MGALRYARASRRALNCSICASAHKVPSVFLFQKSNEIDRSPCPQIRAGIVVRQRAARDGEAQAPSLQDAETVLGSSALASYPRASFNLNLRFEELKARRPSAQKCILVLLVVSGRSFRLNLLKLDAEVRPRRCRRSDRPARSCSRENCTRGFITSRTMTKRLCTLLCSQMALLSQVYLFSGQHGDRKRYRR